MYKTHSHWTVIQEFERVNFAKAIEETIKLKLPGTHKKSVQLHQENAPAHKSAIAMAVKSSEYGMSLPVQSHTLSSANIMSNMNVS